jgi:hypothetical protein
MKNSPTRAKFFLGLASLAAALLVLNKQQSKPISPPSSQSTPPAPSQATVDSGKSPSPLQSSTAQPVAQANNAETQHQLILAKLLHDFSQPNKPLSELVQFLEQNHQEPVVSHNKNSFTGDLAIVRTQNPFTGTRYFHAQYFSDPQSNKPNGFLQHMSFEIPSGPNAMTAAMEILRSSFQNLDQPKTQNADTTEWDLGNGYVLWIKRLDKKDITENPFNAYTENDIGTLRVAIELNPEQD